MHFILPQFYKMTDWEKQWRDTRTTKTTAKNNNNNKSKPRSHKRFISINHRLFSLSDLSGNEHYEKYNNVIHCPWLITWCTTIYYFEITVLGTERRPVIGNFRFVFLKRHFQSRYCVYNTTSDTNFDIEKNTQNSNNKQTTSSILSITTMLMTST